MSFAYFAHIPHSSKFTRGSSLLVEKYLLMEISKAEESSWLKKNLKNNNNNNNKQALRGKKEYHSFKRRRRTSVKATAAGEAPRWLAEFEQRTIASNRNLKAVCRFVILLLSTFSRFSILARVLPLPLGTLPIIVPPSSTFN